MKRTDTEKFTDISRFFLWVDFILVGFERKIKIEASGDDCETHFKDLLSMGLQTTLKNC